MCAGKIGGGGGGREGGAGVSGGQGLQGRLIVFLVRSVRFRVF